MPVNCLITLLPPFVLVSFCLLGCFDDSSDTGNPGPGNDPLKEHLKVDGIYKGGYEFTLSADGTNAGPFDRGEGWTYTNADTGNNRAVAVTSSFRFGATREYVDVTFVNYANAIMFPLGNSAQIWAQSLHIYPDNPPSIKITKDCPEVNGTFNFIARDRVIGDDDPLLEGWGGTYVYRSASAAFSLLSSYNLEGSTTTPVSNNDFTSIPCGTPPFRSQNADVKPPYDFADVTLYQSGFGPAVVRIGNTVAVAMPQMHLNSMTDLAGNYLVINSTMGVAGGQAYRTNFTTNTQLTSSGHVEIGGETIDFSNGLNVPASGFLLGTRPGGKKILCSATTKFASQDKKAVFCIRESMTIPFPLPPYSPGDHPKPDDFSGDVFYLLDP